MACNQSIKSPVLEHCASESSSSSTVVNSVNGRPPNSASISRLVKSDDNFSVQSDIQIPTKRQSRIVRAFRHRLWNVYRRLFSIVFVANIVALITLLCTANRILDINPWHFATAASSNILVGTAIRQDYIQIILYSTAWLIPHSAPLRLRRIVAKLYENGGVHSGCGVAASLWFTALTVILSIRYARDLSTFNAVLIITYVLQALFLLLLIFAYPAVRARFHNMFETTHRFLGWIITILFWVELGLLASLTSKTVDYSPGLVLAQEPSFWFMIIITIHTILPWLNLRRWEFRSENLSKHAVRLHFEQSVSPFTGIAISKSPLFEWHPFATMPSLTGAPTGGSLIVSSAGDWTKDTVQAPRTHYWVKGIPKPGVLGMSLIFKSVVVVTTGSGIGPCLSILASKYRKTACRVLWSSPSPTAIFGNEIVDCVIRVDPYAKIIDTRKEGRPDMVAETYRLFKESNAEAVFVISNPMLTRKIVYGMESRGVPAFGPVWDS